MLPKHRRGPWSSTEDQYLLELVRTQGASNWVKISQLIQSRSPKQCRERYHQNLKTSLNLDPITAEEGVMIERMVAEIGKRWAEIARRLNGRSDNAVKNWWNGGMNRRKRRDNRRAEMAPHNTVSSVRPIHQAGPAVRQLGYLESGYGPSHYRYEHLPSPSNSAATSQPYAPRSSHMLPRPAIEAPLASPSAASYVSRTDASESTPPSLVSDTSVSSSYSQSPVVRYASSELPSPSEPRDAHGRLLPHTYPHSHNAQYDPYPRRDGNITVLPSLPTKDLYNQPILPPLPSEQQWRENLSRTSSPPNRHHARPQLQLPGFQTLALASSKMSEPSSPPKDARMNVNALIH